MPPTGTVLDAEIAKFDALAARWWDPDGPMKPLHRMNPLRTGWIAERLARHHGRDPAARQLLRLLPAGGPRPRAEALMDPVPDPVTAAVRWFVRVRWRPEDRLQRRYCITTRCPGRDPVTGVSKLFGNLVWVSQGRPRITTFRPPGAPLGGADESSFVARDEAAWEPR